MRARHALPVLLLLAALVAAAGCSLTLDLTDAGYTCSGAGQCGDGLRCVHSVCTDTGPTCGDYVLDPGEACDGGDVHPDYCPYGSPATCTACSLSCQPIGGTITYCGDGWTDGWNGEQCDLAAQNGLCGQACSKECRSWSCDREWMWWTPPGDALADGLYDLSTSGVALDTVTRLSWQRVHDTTPRTLAEAQVYCAGLTLGGVAPVTWRVPTRIELLSIVDYTVVGSASVGVVNPTVFPGTSGYMFWTSTPEGAVGKMWQVAFHNGTLLSDFGGVAGPIVRCVH